MAIFRLERKSVSRGNGHNLCAAVAYRAGLKITDNNPKNEGAKTHDYRKKSDVAHREIILTDDLISAGVELDFEQIANLVEIGETTKRGKIKKSAKLANEYVLAGSHELTLDENIQAFREFAEQQGAEQGVVAMLFVHDPQLGNDVRASASTAKPRKIYDPRNIHAHILLLSRKIDLTATGQLELGDKCDSDLSNDERTRPIVAQHLVGTTDPTTGDKIQQGRGLQSNSDWLKTVRSSWADIQNASLERRNIEPVTHESYRALGLDLRAGFHMGKDAIALEDMGIQTYLGARNNEVKQHNERVIEQTANSYIIGTEQTIARATRPRPTPYDAEQWRVRTGDSGGNAVADFDEQTAEFNRLAEQTASNARRREPTVISATATARQIAERDAMMLANRHNDPRYSDAQRARLQGFAEANKLDTGDLRADVAQAIEFFSDPRHAIEHTDVIAVLRHPEQHPITTPDAIPTATTPTETDPQAVQPPHRPTPR